MNQKEFVKKVIDKVKENGLITFPGYLANAEEDICKLLEILFGEDSIIKVEEILKKIEAIAIEYRKILIRKNKAKQGHYPEIDFWKHKKILEETIRKIRLKKKGLEYENIFGLSKNGEEIAEEYDLAYVYYLYLGLVGGAFAIIDSSKNNFLILHDKELQEITDNSFQFNKLPFIQIPYRYNDPHEKAVSDTTKFRRTLNAMYISIRKGQRLGDRLDYFPEFLYYLPSLIQDEDRDKLPMFEKELIKDGFNLVYCSVGEILFHLYAWRMLFRKIQTKNDEYGVDEKIDIEKPNQFEKFELRCDFWKQIKENNIEGPEQDWLDYHDILESKIKGVDKLDKDIETIFEVWREDFRIKVDNNGIRDFEEEHSSEREYTMFDEYENLGLVKTHKEEKYFTREFTELIRYAIYIAKNHLSWSSRDEETEEKNREKLTLFYSLEKKLTKELHNSTVNINEEEPLLDFINESKEVYKNSKNILKEIDNAIRGVAKYYLLKGKNYQPTPAKDLLKQLHRKCRFPVLPYYYELAIGKEHQPKEHLIISHWDSKEIETKLKYKANNDIGAAFSILTINPIWTIHPSFKFTKNGDGIHMAKELSKEAYTRLFRLIALMAPLTQPIIDEVFYGNLIKSKIENNKYYSDLNAFGHEISKIVTNIYSNSNISVKDLFKGKDVDEFVNFMKNTLPEFTANQEKIDEWRIIPDANRFEIWGDLLKIWAGKRKGFVFDIDSNSNIFQIIDALNILSRKISVGTLMGERVKSNTSELIQKYKTDFDDYLKEKRENINLIYSNKKSIPNLILTSNNGSINSEKDAFVYHNAFLRLLVACLSNIYEHSLGNFDLEIKIKKPEVNASQMESMLCFTFSNPCKPKDFFPDSRGTRPVLEICLNLLEGRLNKFTTQKKDPKFLTTHNIKEELNTVWITEFEFPVKHVFQYE